MNHNTIIVEKMVNGGYGLARLTKGSIILLQNSLPGEKIYLGTIEKRKNTHFGEVEKILSPHPQRIDPPCPYYQRCGGCDLQHCSYEGQLDIKTQIIKEMFQGLSSSVSPPLPSPLQFGYRQRIRLQVDKGKIGFFKFRSSEIIPIKACLIAHPAINRILEILLERKEFQTLCRNSCQVELHFNPADETISLLLYYQRKPRPNDFATARELTARVDGLEGLFFKGDSFALVGLENDKGRILSQRIPANGYAAFTLSWEIGGFCQVNLLQNCNLIDYVQRVFLSSESHTVLDLFCGMGNFSIPLAQSAQSLVGVEGQGSSIRCAESNSKAAGLTNTCFIKGAIHDVCRRLLKEGRKFETTIVDPPRQGLPHLATDLASLSTRSIIYISCDPATLVRDIKDLLKHNFHLVSVQPVDMFPQTHHIETIAVLEKN